MLVSEPGAGRPLISDAEPKEALAAELLPDDALPIQAAPANPAPTKAAPTKAAPANAALTETSATKSSPTTASPADTSPLETLPAETIHTEASPSPDTSRAAPGPTRGKPISIWFRHLLSLAVPVSVLGYALTAPHGLLALAWLVPPFVLVWVDNVKLRARTQAPAEMPDTAFVGQLLLLTLLQPVNLILLLGVVERSGLGSIDGIVCILVGGVQSAASAIVVAHELMHRREDWLRLFGRALLVSVLYEHFFTEHIRGHHSRLGRTEDAAVARFGERFSTFLRRTLPSQFASAWQLESKRLARLAIARQDTAFTPAAGTEHPPLKPHISRWFRHRVLQGVAAEIGLLALVGWGFGVSGLCFFLAQAGIAIVLLENVNYIEHWGLVSNPVSRNPNGLSWDTDSFLTTYLLIGLSRHADHHAHPSRPYYALKYKPKSPKLPFGYIGCILLSLFFNRYYRERLTAELERQGFGPFRRDIKGA